ncbi:GNAT family N-acetyltransferase [Streptomyces cinnamoneus]|uniref:GNAT family N-acetyltransferase n=1 Tax=Streptomyces cinnamoneus TaxID=53446 RepID=A0A2G1XGT2_STRCJ|nr:GNAT family N-acetyltransferase [Streptomyces cinnamoneus]PHQ50401.1 GNAT family N-acetyltransferase [Streptomyces cinnamoneus]PPT16452.1 N-acetyltransferase [Streptomyces cinnamoneus]
MTAAEVNVLTVGAEDAGLTDRLENELDAFNDAATGKAERGDFSVRVDDADGHLVGGLTAWTWGGLCGIELLWVREDSRAGGWGSKLLLAAEAEAVRRGCDRVMVSSYTFQAPGFYERHGYGEVGRVPGVPGGHADVYLFKSLAGGAVQGS